MPDRTTIETLRVVSKVVVSIGVAIACFTFAWLMLSGGVIVIGTGGGSAGQAATAMALAAGGSASAAGPGRSSTLRPTTLPIPREPLPLTGATLKGNSSARVVVIEYSEFQCPFCAKFFKETWADLNAKYVASGKVLWAFRNLPLEQIHPLAVKAAEAAQCAGVQNRFWEMHDTLFESQKLDLPSVYEHSRKIGLNEEQFKSCLDGTTTEKVRADMAQARAVGVSGTPTFFFGTLTSEGKVQVQDRISGAAPIAQFELRLDRLLNPQPATGAPANVSRD